MALILTALAAFNLRALIFAVPPILPIIRAQLGLNFVFVGVLTSIPVVALSLFAVPGALLVDKFGARLSVALGLILIAVGGAIRLLEPAPVWLIVGTIVFCSSAAVVQPGIAATIRGWFPGSVQQLSALTTAFIYIGGIAGVSLTLNLLGFGGWRGTFLIWSVPALVTGIAWLFSGRGAGRRSAAPLAIAFRKPSAPILTAAGLLGMTSLVYYGATSWLPFALHSFGSTYVAIVLLAMNLVQIPPSLILATLRSSWPSSRFYYLFNAALATAGALGLVLAPQRVAWLMASILGFGLALIGSGAFALPLVLARSEPDAAYNTAIVLTGGYAIAMLGPLSGGILLQLTGSGNATLWPLVAGTVMMLLLTAVIHPRSWPR